MSSEFCYIGIVVLFITRQGIHRQIADMRIHHIQVLRSKPASFTNAEKLSDNVVWHGAPAQAHECYTYYTGHSTYCGVSPNNYLAMIPSHKSRFVFCAHFSILLHTHTHKLKLIRKDKFCSPVSSHNLYLVIIYRLFFLPHRIPSFRHKNDDKKRSLSN